MELRHLLLIDTVAKVGTLSKAAEHLHLTQSALSHQLKEIEEELGTLMFNRINKRLVISEAGNIIRTAALNINRELENARHLISRQIIGTQGDIRLSTECYTCYHWLPSVIRKMEEEHHKINIQILPEYTKKHFEGLLNNEVDLVITSLLSSDSGIGHVELFQDQQLLIVSKDHPYSTKDFITPSDLKSENLIIYNKPIEESTFYNRVLKPAGIMPANFLEIRLTEAAIQLIKSNMGVKVMAKWAAEPYMTSGDVTGVKIGKDGLHRKWYLAYNKAIGWKKHYDHFKNHLSNSLKDTLLRN